MNTKKLFGGRRHRFVLAVSATAQTADTEKNGHHYNGGPKTGVPHHMGKKEAVGSSKDPASGGHHYTGGPSTSNPHHMGKKKTR